MDWQRSWLLGLVMVLLAPIVPELPGLGGDAAGFSIRFGIGRPYHRNRHYYRRGHGGSRHYYPYHQRRYYTPYRSYRRHYYYVYPPYRTRDYRPRYYPYPYYYDYDDEYGYDLKGFSLTSETYVNGWKKTSDGYVVYLDNGMAFLLKRRGHEWPKGEAVDIYSRTEGKPRWFLGYRDGNYGYWRQKNRSGQSYYILSVGNDLYKVKRVD